MKRTTVVLCLSGLGAGALLFSGLFSRAAEKETADPALVERARKQVRMLDDLYKTAVVMINDNFVENADSLAAGEVARKLFDTMRDKGWHDARLVDATGKPSNSDNSPRDAFEKNAVKALLEGKDYYEEVVSEKDKTYLRAVTLVPVVNQKCTLCHPGHKVGDVLGGIAYKLTVE